jgi:CPA2 family monovalent cation:H+ antiporter-2
VAGLVEGRLVSAMVTAIAISLAVTPPVSTIGRKLAGRLRQGPPDAKMAGDDAPVLVIGMTAAGRAVADALEFNAVEYLALEPDHDRFQMALADGYHVHRANPGDPRSWDAIGVDRRKVLVVATGDTSVSRELTPLVDMRMPGIARIIAVPGPGEIEEMAALGLVPVDMSMAGGAERLTDMVFAALGVEREVPVPGLARDDPMPRAA